MSFDRFVFAGSGRCGTGFISRALSELGLPTGHEAVFDADLDASGSEARWSRPVVYEGHEPYVEELLGDASLGVVLRMDRAPAVRYWIVRHPWEVLRSWVGAPFFAAECSCHEPGAHLRAPWFRAMASRFPDLTDPDLSEIQRALLWLEHVDRELFAGNYRRRKVEDLSKPGELALLAAEIGVPGPYRSIESRARAFLERVGTDINRHPRAPIPFHTLSVDTARRVRRLCVRQGYDLEEATS